ncbi:MAG: hypothetical protein ACYDC1_24150 [Limisphaerales bacterium]
MKQHIADTIDDLMKERLQLDILIATLHRYGQFAAPSNPIEAGGALNRHLAPDLQECGYTPATLPPAPAPTPEAPQRPPRGARRAKPEKEGEAPSLSKCIRTVIGGIAEPFTLNSIKEQLVKDYPKLKGRLQASTVSSVVCRLMNGGEIVAEGKIDGYKAYRRSAWYGGLSQTEADYRALKEEITKPKEA